MRCKFAAEAAKMLAEMQDHESGSGECAGEIKDEEKAARDDPEKQ